MLVSFCMHFWFNWYQFKKLSYTLSQKKRNLLPFFWRTVYTGKSGRMIQCHMTLTLGLRKNPWKKLRFFWDWVYEEILIWDLSGSAKSYRLDPKLPLQPSNIVTRLFGQLHGIVSVTRHHTKPKAKCDMSWSLVTNLISHKNLCVELGPADPTPRYMLINMINPCTLDSPQPRCTCAREVTSQVAHTLTTLIKKS